jgi:hypothetical protein
MLSISIVIYEYKLAVAFSPEGFGLGRSIEVVQMLPLIGHLSQSFGRVHNKIIMQYTPERGRLCTSLYG